MSQRARSLPWRTIPLIVASICIGCGGSSSSSTLFEDHFESYAENSALLGAVWSDPVYGDYPWKVIKDTEHPERLQVASPEGGWSSAIAGDGGWTNYKISALVKPTGGYAGIVARYQDNSHLYVLTLRDSKLELTKGIGTAILGEADFVVNSSTYYKLSMELNGGTIRCLADDVLQFSYTDPSPVTAGKIGLLASSAYYDDVLVTRL